MKLIPLTKGFSAIVDDGDFEFLNQWRWGAQVSKKRKTIYAYRFKNRKTFYMHRVLLNPGERVQVDHKDLDGLNNRRANLRLATNTQNSANCSKRKSNTSGFKGVTRYSDNGTIYIKARISGRDLGLFKTARLAAIAFDSELVKLHGEFARTNQMLGLL